MLSLPGHEVVLDRGVQSDPGGAGSAATVHHRLLSAATWRFCRPLSLIPDYCRSDPQHAADCTHVVGLRVLGAQSGGGGSSSPGQCFQRCELITSPLALPVLTSCASPRMTRMKRCTGCCSWPSVRAARASACSDHPPATPRPPCVLEPLGAPNTVIATDPNTSPSARSCCMLPSVWSWVAPSPPLPHLPHRPLGHAVESALLTHEKRTTLL